CYDISSSYFRSDDHRLTIDVAGVSWVLADLRRLAANEAVLLSDSSSISLGKEKFGGIFNVGESFDVDDDEFTFSNYRVSGNNVQVILDSETKSFSFYVCSGPSKILNYSIKIWKFAPGYTFSASWLDLSFFSDLVSFENSDFDRNVSFVWDNESPTVWEDKNKSNPRLKSIFIPKSSSTFEKFVPPTFSVLPKPKSLQIQSAYGRYPTTKTETQEFQDNGILIGFNPRLSYLSPCSFCKYSYSTLDRKKLEILVNNSSFTLVSFNLPNSTSAGNFTLAKTKSYNLSRIACDHSTEKVIPDYSYQQIPITINNVSYYFANYTNVSPNAPYDSYIYPDLVYLCKTANFSYPCTSPDLTLAANKLQKVGSDYVLVWDVNWNSAPPSESNQFCTSYVEVSTFSDIYDLTNPNYNVTLNWFPIQGKPSSLKSIFIPYSSPIYYNLTK
ncbi:hypothetical protein HZC07_01680, partial [Candidatus Micrarchaeota archaeon]|nr:hypothetical protein [Candidatus Micrarchaeota archaeon]